MLQLLTRRRDIGPGLRLRMLGYFITTILVILAMTVYTVHLRNEQSDQLLHLQAKNYQMQELHDTTTITLDKETRIWKDLLLRGRECPSGSRLS